MSIDIGGTGIGLGTLIAVLVSWTTWHSVGWAILHGILGWIYVVYYLVTQ
jgi:hypothetical protein